MQSDPGNVATDTRPVPVTPAGPLALVQAAIERNMGADELGKLVALAERMEANRAAAAFNGAMNRCQERLPKIVRNKDNTQTRSRYADLEAINRAIVPVYTSEGLSLSFGEDECKVPGHVRIVCDVAHVGGHTKRYFGDFALDGAGFKGTANKTDVQAKGSTLAYGRRYLECLIFNLTIADEDRDGAPPDLGKITAEQVKELRDLIEEKQANLPSFLTWLKTRNGADCIEDIPRRDFAAVLAVVRNKNQKPVTPNGGK